jgi:hypothetical protein
MVLFALGGNWFLPVLSSTQRLLVEEDKYATKKTIKTDAGASDATAS